MTAKHTTILLLATAGLLWLLHGIGFDQVGDAFRRVGLGGAASLAALGVLEAMLDAWALQQAALGRVPFWRMLLINQSGAFLNMAAPAEAGEFLKAALLSKRMPKDASAAILVWNMAGRLTKSFLILLAVLAGFIFLQELRGKTVVCLSFAVLNIGVYAAFDLILRFGGISRFLNFCAHIPLLKKERVRRIIEGVQEAERKTSRFMNEHPLRYVGVLAGHLSARCVTLLTTWAALSAVDASHPFLLCALIYGVMELAGYVVALFPTRVGTLEGSAFLVFDFLGLAGAGGTILQLILRLKQLAVTGSFLLLGNLLHVVPSPSVLLKKKGNHAGL